MMIHPHDPSLARGRRVSGSTGFDEANTIDGAYRLLKLRGLSSVEAGNVVAYIAGLHAVDGGWTVDEIKHLMLLRGLVACWVIES